jgi:hypothetical protein
MPTITPASVFAFGSWADQAAYHMARGYDLKWAMPALEDDRALEDIAQLTIGALESTMIINAYLGEVTHRLKEGRVRRFRPTGELCILTADGRKTSAAERAKSNPVERIGGGSYAARIFVGLKVGKETRWTIDDVIRITYETRKAQAKGGLVEGASILAQHGIYQDKDSLEEVIEPSAQVVIIDLSGMDKAVFVEQMSELAEKLRADLQQKEVILEIQKSGIVEDVYTVKA